MFKKYCGFCGGHLKLADMDDPSSVGRISGYSRYYTRLSNGNYFILSSDFKHYTVQDDKNKTYLKDTVPADVSNALSDTKMLKKYLARYIKGKTHGKINLISQNLFGNDVNTSLFQYSDKDTEESFIKKLMDITDTDPNLYAAKTAFLLAYNPTTDLSNTRTPYDEHIIGISGKSTNKEKSYSSHSIKPKKWSEILKGIYLDRLMSQGCVILHSMTREGPGVNIPHLRTYYKKYEAKLTEFMKKEEDVPGKENRFSLAFVAENRMHSLRKIKNEDVKKIEPIEPKRSFKDEKEKEYQLCLVHLYSADKGL